MRVSAWSHSTASAERVEKRARFSLEEELRGTEDVARRQKCDLQPAHGGRRAKGEDVFIAPARQARLHKARGALRNNDLIVRRDVIAVRV